MLRVNTESAMRFHNILVTILDDIINCDMESLITIRRLEKDIFDLIVNTVPADDLAPTGARACAGTVLTKVRTHMYARRAF